MLELLTNAEMTQADRLAGTLGISGMALMENAGRAVADAVARHPVSTPVAVVAGPGNNGGDGFVAARILAGRGYPVRMLLLGERDRLKGDAAEAAARWPGATEAASPAGLEGAAVIVDALFGAGLDRPVEGAARAMIEAINGAAAHVVAVDLPSGVNGTTGQVMGTAVRAAESVTFFRRKLGHVLLPGRALCGALRLADIGIPDAVLDAIGPQAFLNRPALWVEVFPQPEIGGHKYSRGHVLVLSGGIASTGAARLAARAALRAGAGLVTLATPPAALAVQAAANLAVMVRLLEGDDGLAAQLADPRIKVAVLGPGGGVGEAMRKMVLRALAQKQALVLDADALTSFVDDAKSLFTGLRERADRPAILTPHEGEFYRLFSSIDTNPAVKLKLHDARKASHETSALVVLKGADSVLAAPDGRACIADNAPPT
ncbi:MAG: NAD(P)H-hydrate epimerase, partial [Pseudorhodoplanes sp.]